MVVFMFVFWLVVIAAISYFLGGINGAIITSKYFYRKDIRSFGSGNPGLTNFYRVFGAGGAVGVVLVDVLKTVVPLLIGGYIFQRFYGMQIFGYEFAGFFVLLGHAYPIYYDFKGGKTVMATGVLVIFIDWRIALICWGIFVLMTVITRYVSLSSIIGVLAHPVFLLVFRMGDIYTFILALCSTALLVLRHRENILRLVRGEESRFSFSKRSNKR
jgi:glycerol-3-phosphate acyltransferase PlsY